MGRTGSTGSIAATAITISQPVGGSCTSGFGGGRPGFGSGGSQDSTQDSTQGNTGQNS
jgi:hypothetical protein